MRQQLIDGSNGLYLQRTRSDNTCVFSGDTIPEGRHAVSVRQEINDASYIAWVSIGSINELADALEMFDPEQSSVSEQLSSTPYVKYNDVQGEMQRCGICDDHMPKGSNGISFYAPDKHAPDMVWIHAECRDKIVEGLDRVWDHADTILPEQI